MPDDRPLYERVIAYCAARPGERLTPLAIACGLTRRSGDGLQVSVAAVLEYAQLATGLGRLRRAPGAPIAFIHSGNPETEVVSPTRHLEPEQWFRFGPWIFSIDDAEDLLDQRPRNPKNIDVMAWATAYGLPGLDDPHRRTFSLIGPTSDGLDRDYAMTTDVTKPLLFGTVSTQGTIGPLLIDGVHRLYRAWREGLLRLPAYLLTAEETRQIQREVRLGPGSLGIVLPPPSSRRRASDGHTGPGNTSA